MYDSRPPSHPPKPIQRRALHALVAAFAGAGLAAVAGRATAQDAAAEREREQLRRTQAALRAAQTENQQLRADTVRLQRENEAQGNQTTALESGASAAQNRARSLDARLAEAQADIDASRTRATAQQQALALKEQDLALAQTRRGGLEQQLAASQRSLAERTQTVAALRQLLEQSTAALSAAETANRDLYNTGMAVVELYSGRTPFEQAALQDPLFGLGRIRIQDQAEQLRAKLAALRLPT